MPPEKHANIDLWKSAPLAEIDNPHPKNPRNHSGDVHDPFLGSGTTMLAAQNLGRICYGMEISPGYCAVILDRMQRAFPDLEIQRVE